MVHVRHKLKVLDPLHAWQAAWGASPGVEASVKDHAKKSKMSAQDVALVSAWPWGIAKQEYLSGEPTAAQCAPSQVR
jgi:hypothetical protein